MEDLSKLEDCELFKTYAEFYDDDQKEHPLDPTAAQEQHQTLEEYELKFEAYRDNREKEVGERAWNYATEVESRKTNKLLEHINYALTQEDLDYSMEKECAIVFRERKVFSILKEAIEEYETEKKVVRVPPKTCPRNKNHTNVWEVNKAIACNDCGMIMGHDGLKIKGIFPAGGKGQDPRFHTDDYIC